MTALAGHEQIYYAFNSLRRHYISILPQALTFEVVGYNNSEQASMLLFPDPASIPKVLCRPHVYCVDK